jgi:hypothetical protein
MHTNPQLMKGFAVGIILLFLSTTCIPVLASDGKPDLIIEDLGTRPTNTPPHNWVYCVIKNIGSGTAYDFIDVKVEIKRVLFGLFLINKTIFNSFANVRTPDGYSPGETVDIKFAIDYQLPSWGFFRIYCWVNPDKRIDEENYDNNFYVQDVFVLFGDWEKAL